MNILKPFLNPKKLRKLQNNPQMFFKDALDKRIIPIQNQLKHLKPKKKHAFAEYYIISAVYNVEKYLEDYFNSILKQRLDFKNNIKIICVDDGSTDKSAEIIKNYQKKFPKNIVYLYKENGGQASARNLGLQWLQEQLGYLEGISAETTQPQKSDIMDLRSAGKLLRSVRHDSLMTESYQMRHCEARSNEAIHNVSNPKIFNGEISDYRLPRDSNESLAMTESHQKSDIMDCHENQRFSRNDAEADALDSRHCEARSNEAIHNQTYFKDSIAKTKGEISDYRLPRDSNESLAMTESPQKSDIMDCHDSLRNLAMTEGQTLDYGLPQPLTRLRNDANLSPQKSDIMDCHENQRFSRNDGGVSVSETFNDAKGLRNDGNQPIWVTFTDPDDFLDRDYFYEVDKALEENQGKDICMVGCNLIFYYEDKKAFSDSHPLKYKFKEEVTIRQNKNLNGIIQLSAATAFLKLSKIPRSLYMDEDLKPNFEDAKFVNEFLMTQMESQSVFLRNAKLYYRKRSDKSSTLDNVLEADKKQISKMGFLLRLLSESQAQFKCPPIFIQNTILYDLIWQVKATLNNPNKFKFHTPKEREEFFSLWDRIYSLIDTQRILEFNLAGCWFYHKVGLLNCFKGEYPPFQIAYIDAFDAKKESICIYYFTPDAKDIESIRIDEREVYADYEKIVQNNFLDRVFCYEKRLWVHIPRDSTKLEIFIRGRRARITFKGKQHQSLETSLIRSQFQLPPSSLWLLMDRDTEADDNAEHLYRYLAQNYPKQNIVFALSRESKDWARLQKEGFSLVAFDTQEFRDILKHSSKVISGHIDAYLVNHLGRDTLKGKDFVFLQHGVTHNDLSFWLNAKQINLFITTTKREYDSIANDFNPYKFGDREVRLTGFARHDALLKSEVASHRVDEMMDLRSAGKLLRSVRHENKACKEAMTENPQMRHCERSEAIHNAESRNDTGADASESRHCEARSNEAIHNQTYFKDSIAKTSDCNIIDCHENQRFSRNDGKGLRNDAGASISESRHCEDDRTKQSIMRNLAMTESHQMRHCERSEAIHNVAYFKDSIAKTSDCNIMDCHENQRFSRNDGKGLRNDAGADVSDSRHCEARSNEAIYNQTYFKDSIAKTRGEISDNGLPRDSNESLAMTESPQAKSGFHNGSVARKQILIMPTWRKYLVGDTIGNTNIRKYNPLFIESLYFQTYLSLLQSETLKSLYEKYQCRIVFFPHQNTLLYLKDFRIPDFISMSESQSIQDLFVESDLMITDYSSVAFEMAYLKKPVLYYQFDEEEFRSNQLQSGYFDYRRDGFGPVVATEEELLKELEILLQNDCKVGEPYQSNIENTFEFRDGKCCERIYKAILELDKPYERKWTLDSVLRLAQNALNHQCYKEASERFRFVLEHLGENGKVGLTSLSLRGANEMRDENDAGADALDSRHCEDDRTKQSITLHTKDSTTESQKSDIIDCHENQRFSRNDTGASVSDSRHCERSEAIHNVAQKALSEFRTSEVVLNEEIIFNYLYASRLNQTSQEALEFLKAQGYESRFAFSNQVKFEIIKNYIEILDAQEVIARLEDLRERIPPQELLEFAYLKLRIYAYLGDKQKLKEVYNELKNTYNIDKKDLDLDLFLFQNELIKAASLQAASTSAGGGGFYEFYEFPNFPDIQ